MVSYISGGHSIEYRGLSTDTKPTDVENGAVFICIDTGVIYFFDKENSQWLAI